MNVKMPIPTTRATTTQLGQLMFVINFKSPKKLRSTR